MIEDEVATDGFTPLIREEEEDYHYSSPLLGWIECCRRRSMSMKMESIPHCLDFGRVVSTDQTFAGSDDSSLGKMQYHI
ncbi:hypothetical protein ACLOJK_014867, partial [Asimina triloba]